MNRSPAPSADSQPSLKSQLATALMLCGLVGMAAQWALQKNSPQHAEGGWTTEEKREFRELQVALERPSAKSSDDGSSQRQIYSRMDALDALRLDRHNDSQTRNRWFRFSAVGLLLSGILLYLGSRADDEN